MIVCTNKDSSKKLEEEDAGTPDMRWEALVPKDSTIVFPLALAINFSSLDWFLAFLCKLHL